MRDAQEKYEARRRLQNAYAEGGSDSPATREAAIHLCRVYGFDPFYRYPIWPKTSVPLTLSNEPMPPTDIPCVEEWQLMIRKFRSSATLGKDAG